MATTTDVSLHPFGRSGWRLRTHLLALTGGMILMMLVVIGVGTLTFIRRAEREVWEGRQHEAVAVASGQVGHVVLDALSDLGKLGHVKNAATSRVPYLTLLLDGNPTVVEMVIVTSSGEIQASAARSQAVLSNPFTIAQAQWLRDAADGKTFIGEIQNTDQSEPYVILAVPGSGGNVVAARLQMTVLDEVVANARFGETGQTYVVDQSGRIVAHTRPEIVASGKTLANRPELAALQAPDGQWEGAYTNIDGREVVGMTARVPGTPWLVFTEIHQAEARAASRNALFLLGGGLAVFGLVTLVVLTWRLDRLIIKPMEQLRTAAERIRQGRLDSRVTLAGDNEISQVARAFNTMAEALQARETQLQELAGSLERQVQERTAQLQAETDVRARLQEETTRQAQALMDLSTPLIPVSSEILVMPMIGAIDTRRANQLIETALGGIEQHRARFIVVDITGVPIVDTHVAQALLQVAQSVQLLGARAVLTGIRPEVAQALVGLGVELRELVTYSTLQTGIAYALHRLGQQSLATV